VLSSAARIYRSQGKSGKAAEYLKLAIAAQSKERASAGLLAAAKPLSLEPDTVDDNPFAALPGQTRSRPPVIQSLGSAVAAQALPVSPPGAQKISPLDQMASSSSLPSARALASSPAAYASARATPVSARTQQSSLAAPALPTRPASVPIPAVYTDAPVAAPQATQAPQLPQTLQARQAPPTSQPQQVPPPIAYAQPQPPVPTHDQIPAAVEPLPAAEPAPAKPASPFRNAGSAPQLAQAAPAAPQTLEQELGEIQQARSPTITVGTVMRQRNGEAGLSKLVDVETPITVNFPVGESDDRAFVQATPVTLHSGAPGSSYDANSRFGGGPVAAAAQQAGTTGTAGSQNASGIGVAVGYQTNGIKVDIGSTPFGFRYQNIVGGVRFADTIGGAQSPRVSYGVDVSRRAVTDSVLSFAGARDNRTGESWGGVTSTGGRVSAGLDYDDYGFYGNAGWHSINGHNVASNSRVSATAGSYMHLIREANRQLTAGLNLTAMSYDKNLGYYTYGQGGYFSPQTFISASVPLTWSARDGRLSYSVRGSLGIQHIKQDASPYYVDAARQSAAETAAAANNGTATYSGQSKTGLGYGVSAAAEYQVTPNAFVGGYVGMDNSRDYRQFAGGLYLRYALEAQQGQMPFPIIPETSPYTSN
jgi:hypothetical protein